MEKETEYKEIISSEFKLTKEQLLAKQAAKDFLNGDYVFLDTETTGLTKNDEVVNMTYVDNTEQEVFVGYYEPITKMNPIASKVTGITNEFLQGKPKFKDCWNDFINQLNGRKLIIYNKQFDERLIRNTATKYDIPKASVDQLFENSHCAMILYANYVGVPPVKFKMEEGCRAEGVHTIQDHSADGDVKMMVRLMKEIADPNKKPSLKKLCDELTIKEDAPDSKDKKVESVKDFIKTDFVAKMREQVITQEFENKEDFIQYALDNYPYDTMFDEQFEQKIITGLSKAYDLKTKYRDERKNLSPLELSNMNKTFVELHNLNYSIPYIAKIKKSSVFNIERSLVESFKRQALCVDLRKYVNPKYTDQIIHLSETLETGTRLKPIKELLPPEVTYMNINVVLAYYEKDCMKELKEPQTKEKFDFQVNR